MHMYAITYLISSFIFQHILSFTLCSHFRGMRQGMDLLELADTDLRVNLGGIELGMAQKLLDVADIGPVLQHQRGAGMAEEMTGTGFAQFRRIDVTPHQLRHPIGRKGLPEAG